MNDDFLTDYFQKDPEFFLRLLVISLQIPKEAYGLCLTALKIEAEATGKPQKCDRRTCRSTDQCHAPAFDGHRHPCKIPWQLDTIATMMLMTTCHARQLEIDMGPVE